MVTYCLSNYCASWHVYRHEEYINEVACGILTEDDAVRFAIKVASEEAPSQVVTVDSAGRMEILVSFPVSDIAGSIFADDDFTNEAFAVKAFGNKNEMAVNALATIENEMR
ncbi:MAG TPA: hypothetical protein VGM92_00825 [Candidatus Kapabacteria bacterium]|jgi:hypothetical protein